MTNGLSLEELMKEETYPEEYAEGKNWKILHGDTLKLVKAFQPGIFDAVITDPPYASGGTKQNERNRTTNQKYSSMSAANALPDFDGDNKDQRSWTQCIQPAGGNGLSVDGSFPYPTPLFLARSILPTAMHR